MPVKGRVRRKPNPGKRQLFPSEKESLKGRYTKLSAATLQLLGAWAHAGSG